MQLTYSILYLQQTVFLFIYIIIIYIYLGRFSRASIELATSSFRHRVHKADFVVRGYTLGPTLAKIAWSRNNVNIDTGARRDGLYYIARPRLVDDYGLCRKVYEVDLGVRGTLPGIYRYHASAKNSVISKSIEIESKYFIVTVYFYFHLCFKNHSCAEY